MQIMAVENSVIPVVIRDACRYQKIDNSNKEEKPKPIAILVFEGCKVAIQKWLEIKEHTCDEMAVESVQPLS